MLQELLTTQIETLDQHIFSSSHPARGAVLPRQAVLQVGGGGLGAEVTRGEQTAGAPKDTGAVAVARTTQGTKLSGCTCARGPAHSPEKTLFLHPH